VTVATRAGRVRRLFGRAPDYGELLRLLRDAGANVERATELFARVLERWPDEDGERHDLVNLEHEGDRITHDIIHHLYVKAATPYDRSDVLRLASALDDIVDYSEEAGGLLALYRVEAPMQQAIELAGVMRDAGHEVALSLQELSERGSMRSHLSEIDRLEHEGDRLEREALTALFDRGIDPMVVIRWKDIVERIEQAIDSCDHVGHVLEGIAVKRA